MGICRLSCAAAHHADQAVDAKVYTMVQYLIDNGRIDSKAQTALRLSSHTCSTDSRCRGETSSRSRLAAGPTEMISAGLSLSYAVQTQVETDAISHLSHDSHWCWGPGDMRCCVTCRDGRHGG